MKRSEVQIGKCYRHQGRIVRITMDCGTRRTPSFQGTRSSKEVHAGWDAVNEGSGRRVHIKSAAGLHPTHQGSAPTMATAKARSAEMSTADQLGVLDQILGIVPGWVGPTPKKVWCQNDKEVRQALHGAGVMCNEPFLLITQSLPIDPNDPGTAAYTRVAYGDVQMATEAKHPVLAMGALRILKIFRVPEPTTSRPALSPTEARVAENCVQLPPEEDDEPGPGAEGREDREHEGEPGINDPEDSRPECSCCPETGHRDPACDVHGDHVEIGGEC